MDARQSRGRAEGWPGREGGRERRGPNRVRRGDVQAAILALLTEQDMHGYQIIQELAGRSGGAWRPGPGSIYPTLQSLLEQGFISDREDGSKRVFSITPAGRRLAAAAGDREPWRGYAEADAGRIALRQAKQGLFQALAQVESAGQPRTIERATELVAATRKSLYLLLAEEDL